MQPSDRDKTDHHSFFDISRAYLSGRLAVLNWISSRYLYIELSRQLNLWPYMPLTLLVKRIFRAPKK